MTATRIYHTKGDTLTPVGVQLKAKDATGAYAVIDLTGLTVKFHMVDDDGADVVAETTTGVTVTDAANGKVMYDFQAADVDEAGTFYGWFLVYSGTEVDSYPVNGRKLEIEIVERA